MIQIQDYMFVIDNCNYVLGFKNYWFAIFTFRKLIKSYHLLISLIFYFYYN